MRFVFFFSPSITICLLLLNSQKGCNDCVNKQKQMQSTFFSVVIADFDRLLFLFFISDSRYFELNVIRLFRFINTKSINSAYQMK